MRLAARERLRTLGLLTALGLTLPGDLALTTAAVARSVVRRGEAQPASGRTVLLTGGKMTKALALARAFHRAGHRVVLVESAKYRFTGHRFSRCVDAFHTVPEAGDASYAAALRDVVVREAVDVVVPVCSPASSVPDAEAMALLEPHCEVLHLRPEDLARVDDKEAFARLAGSMGLAVPESHRVTSAEQVADFDYASRGHRFILKHLAYDPVNRLDLTLLPLATREETLAFARSKQISEADPWVLQEMVEGRELCTHGTMRDGQVRVWGCCESSAWQLNYAMVEHPGAEEWVTRFAKELGATGQLSFDFIERADGTVTAIECNPRTHSAITMFYDHPGLAAAYLDDGAGTVRPTLTSRPTYWTYHEVWRLLRDPRSVRTRWRVLREGTDAIFDWDDPLPFLLVHHLQLPSLLLVSLWRGSEVRRVDLNIGKLVEAGGD